MRLSVEDVESLAKSVLVTLKPKELELQDREGNWRELRLRPYRTADNRIQGVVLVLMDIDQLRRAKGRAAAARQFAESVIEAVQIPLLVLRADLRIRLANRAFYKDYGLQPPEVENQLFLEIGGKQWDLPGLRDALKEVVNEGVSWELEFDSQFADQRKKSVCMYLRPVQPDGEKLVVVAIEEITAQKTAERVLVLRQEQLKATVRQPASLQRIRRVAYGWPKGERDARSGKNMGIKGQGVLSGLACLYRRPT
jgi:two-component system CheB/CheR fusion protein